MYLSNARSPNELPTLTPDIAPDDEKCQEGTTFKWV